MGLSTEWVRGAIDEGVSVEGMNQKLEADTVVINRRRINRIRPEKFVDFLRRIRWPHLPKLRRDA